MNSEHCPNETPDHLIIENPILADTFAKLYEEKMRIYHASPEATPDMNPSEFVCSGGSSTYFEQPIDPEKRYELKHLYDATLRHLEDTKLSGWRWRRGPRLSESDDTHCEDLVESLKERSALLLNTEYRRPVDGTAWSTVPQFLQDAGGTGRYSMRAEDDFEHARNRLKGFVRWTEIAMAMMNEGIREKDTLPQILGERALYSLEVYLENNARGLRDIFIDPLQRASVSDGLRKAYTKEVEDLAMPAYDALATFMRQDYMPHCRDSEEIGLYYAPDGYEQYKRLVRYHTSSDASPDEAQMIAWDDYDRSQRQLQRTAHSLEFESAEELTVFLLNDTAPHPKSRPFTDVQQVLEGYEAIAERVRRGLSKVFLPEDMPNDEWSILPVTDHTAASTPATYSNGVFRAPIIDIDSHNAPRMHKLFLHEVNPGHHTQISSINRTLRPRFLRHTVRYPGLREGWAMYAETLADDIGVPYTKWTRAARLCSKVSTAALSCVDVSMHGGGRTLTDTRAFLEHYVPGYDRSQEARFILRNALWPAQGHSYTYGEEMMHRIRSRAAETMGRDFDLRMFHNIVLSAGERTLPSLSRYVTEHIDTLHRELRPDPPELTWPRFRSPIDVERLPPAYSGSNAVA